MLEFLLILGEKGLVNVFGDVGEVNLHELLTERSIWGIVL